IIGRGYTQPYGCDHAEIMAIKSATESTQDSEMYVTLEPCCHYGKTPPCTKAIIEAGIRKVHIPLLDPNPRVSGKGIIALKEAGVEVVFHNDFADAAADILRPFKKIILRNRPFVILKLALSLDGYIANTMGESKWITNEHSRYIVHRLRGLCDGVIVGKNTLIKDNPKLTIRLKDFRDEVKNDFRKSFFEISGRRNFLLSSLLGDEAIFEGKKNPCRIIFGIPQNITNEANVFADCNYIIFEHVRNKDKILSNSTDLQTRKKDYEEERMFFLSDAPFEEQVQEALDFLGKKGFMMLMLEGGARLAGAFLSAKEIDQFLFFVAPKIFGSGKRAIEANTVTAIGEELKLSDISTVCLHGDVLIWGYTYHYHFESM
ncbi:MAG: bifunctional diaminohydroxyphosphoribosylaminopyrimidine deaminase/5-amino-6-(5-phosphoribosylamino)uracil reductase RibD, partial [Spirochaetes bacterium]|nr:bifunctional diaminohydroxyphosphoribosylaminopyrimidine deaminase/5-amino-6-(5-phosphoribosylamino)uracil reductase RibD [Spirochaetota bacterium]